MLLVERILTLGLGLVIGVALGWLFRALKQTAPDSRIEAELRAQVASREAELSQLRASTGEAGSARAAAEASRAAAEQLGLERGREAQEAHERAIFLRDQLATRETELATARAEIGTGTTLLAEQRRVHAEQTRSLRETHDTALAEARAAQERALAALRDQFKATAAEALAANNPKFLELANELFARFQVTSEGDLTQRQEKIAALVRPLEAQLRDYQERLQQSDSQQQSALGQVKQQLEGLATQSQTLANETQRLRVVLSSNQARGRWGEETLRRVVEAAGLSTHCDFTEQLKEGDSKPDLVVRLPGNRVIIVDSKVPDLEFLNALNLADETKRADALHEHAAKLKTTIKSLADRDYPAQFANALDYVVLFLPAESLFSAALEGDRDLIVWAAERRILLATPASLIALLRSVAVSWQQHDQSMNARAIAEAARELFERVLKFIDHFESIRDGLQKTNEAYNRALASYETRVRPQGEKLAKLGAALEHRQMADVEPVDAVLRLPPTAAPANPSERP
jgi:DNA recombination protein RmuC